jgi:hypothetical protein
VKERDSKRIIRQWDREIEDQIRRERRRDTDDRRWKAVGWGAIWLLWLGVLIALVDHLKALR